MLEFPQVGKGKATFCLIDQRVFECEWATLERIAVQKEEPKIELMYFLGTGWLDRAMSELHDKSIIEKWWGRPDWSPCRGMDAWNKAAEFWPDFVVRFALQLRVRVSYFRKASWPKAELCTSLYTRQTILSAPSNGARLPDRDQDSGTA